MKTIIAATDFSPAATNAVNYAADMAIALNADLLLLYTFQVPVGYAEVPVAIDLDEMQRSAENQIKNYKEKLLLRTNSKLAIATEVRVGTFSQELKVLCEKVQPYAVVMGSQGTTATERLLFGSHTVYAMKHLEWPLVTVPPGAVFSSIKNIALACDFENVVSSTPIQEIKSLVAVFNAKLHVINTGRKDEYNSETIFGSSMLKTLLNPIEPEYHFIYDKNTDDSIIQFVEKNHIDLLVVLPKRHGLMEKLFNKSHSKQMVLHSHVPVMALHGHV